MSLARGLQSQLDVVHALVLRETKTRFGAYRLGYLWAFLEPLLWVGTFYVMFWLLNREAPFGMDMASFMTTGIIPYFLFRDTAQRAVSAIDGNKALLFYPQVRPLDLVFARVALEAATFTLVFICLLSGIGLLRGEMHVDSLLFTLVGLALAASLGFGLGLCLCSLSVFWPSVPRMVSPLLRPLFWISGLYFTANSLPSTARELLLWNPVLHVVELVRDGWFPTYHAHYASVPYVLGWIAALAFMGLTLERLARRSIEAA